MRQIKLPQAAPERISRINFLNRREVSELPNMLNPGEQVLGIVSGFYISGTAILCITTRRLLLLDKKWIRINFEDARLESISELNYSHNGLMASVRIFIAGRELEFRSWYKKELRMLAQFVQHKMAEAQIDYQNEQRISAPQVPQYQASAQVEQYLSERIARWRRANRFIDSLPQSTGNQTLEQQY